MDANDFRREINSAWKYLHDNIGIGKYFICGTALVVDDVFRDVALDTDSSYAEIFRTGLSRSHYNILLADYSYLQFRWASDTSWGISYLSNPWLSGVPAAEELQRRWETLEEIGALSHEDVSALFDEMPYSAAIPPIRFEYAPEQYRELIHPAAHFHIGHHTQNRWPSGITVGPVAFALILSKLYYNDAWVKCSKLHGADVTYCMDTALSTAVSKLLAVQDFSTSERKNFHFGKNMT